MEIEPFIVNVNKSKLKSIAQLKYKIDTNFELELHFKYDKNERLMDVFFYIPSNKTTNVENAKKYVLNLVFPEDKTTTNLELAPLLASSFESGFLLELLEIKYGLHLIQDKNKVKIIGEWKDVNNFVKFAENVNDICRKIEITTVQPGSKSSFDSKISSFIKKSRSRCLSKFEIKSFLNLPQELKQLLYLWITTDKEIDIPFECQILPETNVNAPIAVIDISQDDAPLTKSRIKEEVELKPQCDPKSKVLQKGNRFISRTDHHRTNRCTLAAMAHHIPLNVSKENLVALLMMNNNICLSPYKVSQILYALDTCDYEMLSGFSLIVIDGFNVMREAGDKDFCLIGLQNCIQYFENRNNNKIVCFMPPAIPYSDIELAILYKLQNKGYLMFFDQLYDNNCIAMLASVTKGVLVSNFHKKSPYKDTFIIDRLVEFTFEDKTFTPL